MQTPREQAKDIVMRLDADFGAFSAEANATITEGLTRLLRERHAAADLERRVRCILHDPYQDPYPRVQALLFRLQWQQPTT